MAIRVLTVDDQPVFLEAARALIGSTPGFELAGEARSGIAGIAAVERLHPDLVLLDVTMPGLDGIETTRRLSADPDSAAVIVLVTSHDLDDVRAAAASAGAAEIVGKERLRPSLLRELWARHGRSA